MNRSDDLFSGGPTGTPNHYWQRAFDAASETPPPRVWDAVERQLDLDDEDGIIPLWQHRDGQRSMLFGRWVAGIAASLLLTLFGWWAWHRDTALPTETPAVATTQTRPAPLNASPAARAGLPVETPTVANVPSLRREGAVGPPQHVAARRATRGSAGVLAVQTSTDPSALAVATPAGMPSNVPVPGDELGGKRLTGESVDEVIAYGRVTLSLTASPSGGRSEADQPQPASSGRDILYNAPVGTSPAGAASASLNEVVMLPKQAQSLVAQSVVPPAKAQQAAKKEVDQFANESAAEVVQVKQQSARRKAWVSVGAGTSAFNPEMALRASAMTSLASNGVYSNAIVSQASQPTSVQAAVGRAVAIQAGFGLPLGDHWAIETGVGYLSSQGTVSSPVRTASVSTTQAVADNRTLYTDLIANRVAAAQGNAQASPTQDFSGVGTANRYLDNSVANYSLANQRSVSNNYQFVQVPAQVSYEFRPRRKFGLSLLTGLVSNWFVRNTVAETVTVRSGDGIYRPVTVAGTAGLRVRYRPDRHWSASLAGTFQQNLQSLTLNDVNLQALPQQVGVSFSVDRHF